MACCYAGCNHTRKKNPDLTFFRFPKEKERRYLWMKKCNNTNIQNFSFEELQNRVVCESHFLPKCFDYSLLRSGRTRRSLFKFALPEPASVIEALKKENDSRQDTRLPPPATTLPPVVSSSSLSSLAGIQKQKDLVSPQRLMNILENSCPLIRPISPTTSEADDPQDVVGLPSLIPEVTLTTTCSPPGEDSFEEEMGGQTTPILPVGEEGNPPLVMASVSSPTTTVTTTSACSSSDTTTTTITSSCIPTTTAAAGIAVVNTAEAYHPILPASKRSLESISPHQEELDWGKSFVKRQSTKYKKILPKQESRTTGAESRILLATEMSPVHTTCTASLPKESDGSEDVVLNLSGLNIKKLEKIPKAAPAALTTSLYLDNNLLQTLPTIDCYRKLTKISLVNNQIDSLIWFGRLTSLKILNLSGNKLTDIDGLWKLWHLTHVTLKGNQIQVLRGFSSDPKSNLEFLDLSNNKITAIGDLSMLVNLKELLLHQNRIQSLSQGRGVLPNSLINLTLADNSITNLGDVAELSHLNNLRILSLQQNPCLHTLQLVDPLNNPVGPPRSFDARPYVLTWCPHLTCLDDRAVDEQERAKARWLFSQEKFKDIYVAKHASLVTYLSEACPLLPQELGNTISHCPGPTQSELPEQARVTGPLQGTLSPPRSFSLVKVPLPLNNNTLGEKSPPKTIQKQVTAPSLTNSGSREVYSTPDCSADVPCKHYIELIEEKAQNYKLKRSNEVLDSRIEELMQRIQLLEAAIVQSGLNIEELAIKIEVDDNEESD